MKAITYHRYGSPEVLELEEIPKPIPKDDEVLVKIHAATVGTWDCEGRSFNFPLWFWLPLRLAMGIRTPRWPVLGQDLSGEIEAVGKDVTRFEIGDAIFASTGLGFGAHAEYKCLRARGAIALKKLIEADKIRAVIDRRYPLARAAEAHAYVDTGRRRGTVVLTITDKESET